MQQLFSMRFVAVFLSALCVLGCAKREGPAAASLAPASSETTGVLALAEPEPLPLLIQKEVEALPEQVKSLAQTSAEVAHLFSVAPDGTRQVFAEWNEYVYANPRLSPDKNQLLLRTYARSEDGKSDLWSANLVVDLTTGMQRYCEKEPSGSKNMQWVGDSTIGCVVTAQNRSARDLFFFDQDYQAIAPPFPFAPPSDTRIISGLWMGDSSCSLVVAENLQGIEDNGSFLVADCFLETVDQTGAIINRVALDGYAAPINSYKGFGSPIQPLGDGRLLIRLYPLDSPQQSEFYRERWVVATPEQGVLYEISDCHSILALDGKRLFYLEPSIEENNWMPNAYLCTLGENGVEGKKPFAPSGLQAKVGERERSFRVGDPTAPHGFEAAVFDKDRLWVSATVQQQENLISSDYSALFCYDLNKDTHSLSTLLPRSFSLIGCDGAEGAMILGAQPYYRYAQDDYQNYEQGDEARWMREGTDFWNNRGQLFMASGLPTFDLAGTIDPISSPNPDRIWQGINRIYAYLFWQNGQSPAQYTLSAEQMNRRFALLFGETGWEQHLKNWQNADGGYTLTELSPDPEWESRPWISEGVLVEIYDDDQTRFWTLDCSRYDPQKDTYEYRKLILKDCDASSRLIAIRE